MTAFCLPIEKPIVAAHRGASRRAPENTLSAFRQALSMGVPALELDVQLSSDGRVVVIHDQLLNRTTNGTGLVQDHSIQELRSLDAGRWFSPSFEGERVPVLEEVLELAKGKCLLHIELKHGPIFYQSLEQRVIEHLREFTMEDDVLLMSFDHVAIKRAKQIAPEIPACITYSGRLLDPVRYVRDVGADGINQPWYYLTPETVEKCHESNFFVHASLIDDESHWHLAQQLHVDLVDTNNIEGILAHTQMKIHG